MLTTSIRSIHHIPVLFIFLLIFDPVVLTAQESNFPYSVRLEQVSVPGLPGFHSYAYGQHDGKWLIVGGRTDGIHARQPFASFPPNHNNDHIFVIDPSTGEFFAESLNPLTSGLREHLQSTNMNFHQIADTLYIIGGYAFSETAGDHITFPKLTTIVVSETMNDVINGSLNDTSFGHLYDERFAVTGGQLGELDEKLILVGGHRFDGLAQFYFQGDQLIQDDRVPFVTTISRVTRFSDGSFAEFALPEEMPGLRGTSAEFIPNPDLPKNKTGVILMDEIGPGELLVGYIVGGIDTPIINPFVTNQTERTSASTTVYEVWLDRSASDDKPVEQIKDGTILYPNYPNPFDDETTIHFSIEQDSRVDLDIFSAEGRKVATLISSEIEVGEHKVSFNAEDLASGVYIIRLTVNGLSKSRAITFVRSKQ